MVNGIHKKRSFGKSLLLLVAILFFFATPAYALDVTLQWDANQDTVTGYYIYYRVGSSGGGVLSNYNGTGADQGNSPIDMPLSLDENPDLDIVEFTVTDLPNGETYYFVVTAYNNDVVLSESSASNEVSSDAPPPADTTAPIISNIQATSITDTSAVITWTTDETSDSEVQYGTAPGSYPSSENNTSMVTSHSINLTGLSQNTTYYYRVRSEDASTNARTSSEMTFATNPAPDGTAPSIVQYPTINYANDTIDVTFSEPVESQLVENGNMESNGDWVIEKTPTVCEQSNEQVHTGAYSWKFTSDSTYDGMKKQTGYITETGKTYTVSLWVYPDDTTSVHLIHMEGGSGSQTYNNVFTGLTQDAWNLISYTYTETLGGATGNIRIQDASSSGFPNTYYVDDVSVLEPSGSGGSGNAVIEANYSFSPSLLFDSLGGSDDITYLGGNTCRLSMSSIPANTIFTMTVSNITDEAGNPLTPNSVRINDDDNDGMADDWEVATGVGTWSGDPDSDGLNNLEEFNNGTDPNNLDTDGDTLPDLWEVVYGLDPTDSTGNNGRDGDFDADGWTNSEEYLNGYDPSSDTSPTPTAPPEIRKTIPINNSGITNTKRVPTNTSFAVYLRDVEGIDITDTSSIEFIINDGVNPAYTRNLSNPSVFRVVKLTTDDDDQVTKLWAVYDRSLDSYGDYQYDANVNIKVNAKDRTGMAMDQASFDFNVETSSEQMAAQDNEPYTSTLLNSPSIGLTTESIDSGMLAGAKVIYDSSEPIQPKFGPVNEVPIVGGVGITPAPSSYPINLEPPTVFNNPVTIFIPFQITSDVDSPSDDLSTLSIALYDGESWVVACDANGNVTPAGDGWMVPGSRVNHSQGFPPSIELQVYHFSAVQAAVVTGGSSSSSLDASALSGADGGGGGCFIGSMGKGMDGQNILVLLITFALAMVCIVMAKKSRARKS
jgi:hypothetical protein